MKHTFIKIVAVCLLVSGLLSCNKSDTSNDSNSNSGQGHQELTENFVEWLKKNASSEYNIEVISSVVSEDEFPYQVYGTLLKKGALGMAYRAEKRPEKRQKYRDAGQRGWYMYVSELQETQAAIQEEYNNLKERRIGTDSIIVCYTAKVSKIKSLDPMQYGKYIAIFNRKDTSSPIAVAALSDDLLKSITAVSLALKDSLVTGDIDYETLHREATNPVMKAIYAPLPQAN